MVGWRYTLRIPSWSQVQLQDGETVVFFQVEVTVLPPDDGAPRKRSVGRRYSNFVTLYQRLREELGQRMLVGLEPPPKRSFSGVNKKPELIERRRWELEQWLWRLTEVPRIANSAMMFHFCELAEASRVSTRPRGTLSPSASATVEQSVSVMPSYAPSWSGSELSDHIEGASEAVEGDGTATDTESAAGGPAAAAAHVSHAARGATAVGHEGTCSHAAHAAQWQQPSVPYASHQQNQRQSDYAAQRGSLAQLQPSHYGSSSLDSLGAGGSSSGLAPSLSALLQHSAAGVTEAPASLASGEVALTEAGGHIRLGLQVEHRAAIKGLTRALRSQLEMAAADMQDAARTIANDNQVIAQLAAQAEELKGSLSMRNGGASPSADPREQQAQARVLVLELRSERDRSERLLADLLREREGADSLAAQLAAAQQTIQMERKEREAREVEAEALQQQLQEAQKTLVQQAQLAAAGEGSAAESQALEAKLSHAHVQLGAETSAKEELAVRVGELEAATAKAVAEQEAATAKSRADLKVLAREIKGLRAKLEGETQRSAQLEKQLAEAQQQLAAVRQEAATRAAAGRATAQQQVGMGSPGPAATPAGGASVGDAEAMADLLRTVTVLRSALGDCRVDSGSIAADPGQHPAPGPTTQAQLAGAERKLQGLKDRVRRELPALGGNNAASAEEAGGAKPNPSLLRSAFGGLLLDAAEARRSYYELLRSTLAVSAHLEGLEQRVGTSSVGGTPVSSPTKITAHSLGLPAGLALQQQEEEQQLQQQAARLDLTDGSTSQSQEQEQGGAGQ